MTKPTQKLYTIEEHNQRRIAAMQRLPKNMPSEIACPACGEEMIYPDPDYAIMTNPPRKTVVCPKCDAEATVIA